MKDSLIRMVASSASRRNICGICAEFIGKRSRRCRAGRLGGRAANGRGDIIAVSAEFWARLGDGRPERGDFQKARTALIADLIGRSAVTVKLRPAGRVALEWARLSAE